MADTFDGLATLEHEMRYESTQGTEQSDYNRAVDLVLLIEPLFPKIQNRELIADAIL